MQNILHALKNWYPTSVVPEPEFRAQEAEYRRLEEHVAELAQIVQKANKNGVYLKAPNGKPTNLTEHQWALVRTKAFKQEFGDWEHAAQVAKLLKSEPIVATGEEWKGKYELDRQSVRSYIAGSLRSNEGYKNKDTGSIVKISKKKASKTASHGSEIHLKTATLIPQIIENAIYLGEEPNNKNKHGFTNFRYYAVGLKLDGVDYTVRLTTGVGDGETYYDHALTKRENAIETKGEGNRAGRRGSLEGKAYDRQSLPTAHKDERLISLLQGVSNTVDKNGETYYDHALSKIKKGELADRRGSLEGKAYDRRGPLSEHQDRRLLSLLQVDCSKFSNLVDENGEPKVAEVEAFERKHADVQLQQLSWIKQDDKAFGWFNQNTGEIVLCEGHNISTTLEAFWHATFRLTKTSAPRLYFKMLAFARKTPKRIKYACKKFYPELKAGSEAWFDKLGAMRFVMDYADKIENSMNNRKSFFAKVLRVFSGDRVNLGKIAKLPSKKAVAALANAFAHRKHLARSH